MRRLSKDSKHRTLGGRLYETLAREIISGKMRPGERLVEDEIGKRFKASRTPVREALNKLAKDDLVEHLRDLLIKLPSPHSVAPATVEHAPSISHHKWWQFWKNHEEGR